MRGKRPKYGNHKVTYQGKQFASEGEMARYIFLSNREKEGEISGLRTQVEYLLIPAQYRKEIKHLKTKDKEIQRLVERPCSYVADFVYERNGQLIVEDYKGSKYVITETAKMKKKLLLWVHNIELKYIFSPTFWEK